MRKGQITLFVILGIVLTIIVVSSFIFREGIIEKISDTEIVKGISMSEEARMVQSDMEGCMENLASESLVRMSLQGGYLDLGRVPYAQVPESLDYLNYDGTAYLYYKGQNKVPNLRQMQSSLAKELTTLSVMCKKEYKDLSLSYGRVVPKVEIMDGEVKFDINWVIDIQKGDRKSTVKHLKFEIPSKIGKMRNVVNEIVESQTGEICLSCLAEIGFENDMAIDMEKIDEDIFYLITDQASKNENFIFLMANKF